MTELGTAGGPLAAVIICLLVLVEEAGVPLPMFPGDGLLLVGGIMVAGGQVSPWLFFPLAYGCALTGGMIGYAWSARLGRAGLERLAGRLGVRRHLDRAS